METYTKPKPVIKPKPIEYSSEELIAGEAPDGVYIGAVDDCSYENYLIVLHKHVDMEVTTGVNSGQEATVILDYYPDSGQLVPGTPQPNYYWVLVPADVIFDIKFK